jgi:glycosyltransferase involved in cell wall biosynthesis
MTVSRLAASERYKGHDRVLNALPALIAERPKLTYLVVGEGDDRARLEGLVAQLGITENVRFIGSVLPRELPDYYRLADVFVMPSTGEGFGIVFLEAMASGVPTIAGHSDGSRDPLCDGTFGALIDPNSTRELQAAIRAALDNPSVRSDGAERFGAEKFAEHVNGLVRFVLVDAQLASRRIFREYVVTTTTVRENGSRGRACDTI